MKKAFIGVVFLATFIILINNQAKAQTRATITIGINAPEVRIGGVSISVKRPASAVLLRVDLTQGIISDWNYAAIDLSGYGISGDLISAGSLGLPSSWPYANGTLFKLEYDITDVPVQEKSDFFLEYARASGLRDSIYVFLGAEYFSFDVSLNVPPANQAPIISSFDADPTSGYIPFTVNFSCNAYDPDGYIAEYRWDFDGDGNSDETTIADTTTYTYQNAGTYYARVTVVDNGGATTTSDPITINVSQFTTISLDIKVNESDSPITLSQSDTLSISISLNNNGQTHNADWWLAADTPFGWYYYDVYTESWLPGLSSSYQGPLFNLNPIEVLNIQNLPIGTYTFYFAVDTNMDGSVTSESLYYDYVTVNITVNEKISHFFENIGIFMTSDNEKYLDVFVEIYYPGLSYYEPFGCIDYGGIEAVRQCKALINFYVRFILDKGLYLANDAIINNSGLQLSNGELGLQIVSRGNNLSIEDLIAYGIKRGDIFFVKFDSGEWHYGIIYDVDESSDKIYILDANYGWDGKIQIHELNPNWVPNMDINRF